MLTTDRLDLFDRPDGKSYLTKSELKELTTAYRELKKIKEQAPVAEFVTLFSTPKGTVEFLGRVPDRKLCDLKEGDLLYKQEAIPAQQSLAIEITKEMIYSFCHAISDASVTEQEFNEVKIGLTAAFSHFQQSPAVAVHGNWDEEAYKSVCDNLEQWKSRAIEAEDLLERIRNDMAPTHMGEPVISDETVNQALIAAGYARDALRYKNELDRLLQSPRITEQDAREIAKDVFKYVNARNNPQMEGWEDLCLQGLLAKLNEAKHD